MKIYTKSGDSGTTSLIGGKRVPKSDVRIEAYGTVDELIAFTGLLRDGCNIIKVKEELLVIQGRLMVCASILAADCDNCEVKLPKLEEQDIQFLESSIDRMEVSLKPLQSFILPGGNVQSSYSHVARTVCRRAEREVLRLNEISKVDALVLKYLNRLADYFFVLSRFLAKETNSDEITWQPELD
jgi:cob(I)alamin adenosyltransferase